MLRLLLLWFFEIFVGKMICRLLCLVCLCVLLGDEQETSVGEFDKGKMVIIIYRFLYTFLASFGIFLWFHICFSVFRSFRKKTEEMTQNRAKMGEN